MKEQWDQRSSDFQTYLQRDAMGTELCTLKTFFKLNMSTTTEIGFEKLGLPKSNFFSIWHALCKVHSEILLI